MDDFMREGALIILLMWVVYGGGYKRGRDGERAAVVRWLRDFGVPSYMDGTVLEAADAIERGEHRKEPGQ